MSDRKHVKTGKPRGGYRPEAGRKPGLTNYVVPAIKSLRHRVPEGTPEELATAADRAFQRIVEVMEGDVPEPQSVLKAAALLRDEICGPVAQKHLHSGADGKALEVVVRTVADADQPGVSDKQPALNGADEPPASPDEEPDDAA